MWSGPRNVSTALMYSFANRGDLKVLDEPFFGHFLEHTGVWRPSRKEVLQTMELSSEKVWEQIQEVNGIQRVFLKNMANHLEGVSMELLGHCINVVLVRKPSPVIASYTSQVEQPTVLDLCYDHQLQILEYLEQRSLPYYLLDSDEVRKNPETVLRDLCTYLDIPFSERMLHWEAGVREEDGVWAKYWYHNVHKSTGFMPYEEKEYEVPARLEEVYSHCEKRYHEIKKYQK